MKRMSQEKILICGKEKWVTSFLINGREKDGEREERERGGEGEGRERGAERGRKGGGRGGEGGGGGGGGGGGCGGKEPRPNREVKLTS